MSERIEAALEPLGHLPGVPTHACEKLMERAEVIIELRDALQEIEPLINAQFEGHADVGEYMEKVRKLNLALDLVRVALGKQTLPKPKPAPVESLLTEEDHEIMRQDNDPTARKNCGHSRALYFVLIVTGSDGTEYAYGLFNDEEIDELSSQVSPDAHARALAMLGRAKFYEDVKEAS